MAKRNATATEEPEVKDFPLPSEKEHLFQIADIIETIEDDPDIVHVKCEVVGGDEAGRTLLNRCTLNDNGRGFFATRFLLKSIGCQYKGDNFPIDSDEWQGKQFYATVVHNKGYANIKEFNFDKIVEKQPTGIGGGKDVDNKPDGPVEWDADQ